MPASLLAALLLQTTAAPPPPPPPPPPAPAAGTEGSKVVSYPAAFFAQYRPDNAFDMLGRVPGFTLVGEGGQRGFAGGEGNVRLDGQIPASRGDNMQAILRRLPASAVERIDVVTGGAGGIDMQGQSVIANIIRKSNLGLRTTVIAGGTVFENQDPTATIRVETQKTDGATLLDGLFIAFGEHFGGEGQRVRGLTTPIVSTTHNPVTTENARVSGAYERPLAGGRTRFNATYGYTGVDSAFIDTPESGALPSIEKTHQNAQLGEAGGRYTRTLGGGANVELSAFHQYRRNDLTSDFEQGATNQLFSSKNRQNEDILRGLMRWPKRGAWTFDLGAETAYNTLDASSQLTLTGPPVPSLARVEELRGEIFGGAVWTLSPTFNLQFGARVEHSTISTEGANATEETLTFLKPRVIATWIPAKNHLVVLRVERTVDQLSFNDFVATANLTTQTFVAGAPELVPAENLIAEARYEYRFLGRGALVLTAGWRDIDNVVGRNLFTTPAGVVIEAPDNIGAGTRQFFGVNFTLPTDKLGLKGGLIRINHVWRDSEITDPVTLETRRFSSEFQWERFVSISQEIPNTKWKWEVTAGENAELVTFNPRELITSKFSVNVNANIEYRPAPDVTLRLDLFNLANQHGPFDRLRYSGPRGQTPLIVRDERENLEINGGTSAKFTVRKAF